VAVLTNKEWDQRASAIAFEVAPATESETIFRHSHWSQKRSRVRQAMIAVSTGRFAQNRFDECGSECTVEWSETENRHRIRGNYCHSRHCEPCMRSKANKIAQNLAQRLAGRPKNTFRFITLTLKHSQAPLRQQITRLYRSFRTLKAQKLWKRSQQGGAVMLECKWTGTHWHPHLHIISEGSYMRKDDLSDLWLKATGDSMIVDIRVLTDTRDASHYVSKYITKGTSAATWANDDAAQEWVLASKGVRICNTFGTWRGFRLLAAPTDVTDWVPVCTLNDLIARANDGEVAAIELLLILRPPGASDADPAQNQPAGRAA
jgi:hypothetical protein